MKKSFKIINIITYLEILLISLSGCAIANTTASKISTQFKDKLIVHYIDVGQADCALIQVNGKNLLIDAGGLETKDKVVTYIKKQGVNKLDYVIATHPHEDHIGGMSSVLKSLSIGDFFAPKKLASTNAFENMIYSLDGKKVIIAKPGIKLDLGKDTNCEMLAPSSENYEDINNYSVVIKLTYKNNKFLFMGDAQKLSEQEIINSNADISCDVLKVGHHGSLTSSSKEFLDKSSPKIAVISSGRGNQFGHPHKETIAEFKKRNYVIYRTDIDGTIVLVSDGKNIKKQ